MSAYNVRSVKSFEGRNGPGFSATLYNGGRKVALVRDEARGGAYWFDWLATHPDDRANDEAALDAHVATLPKWFPADPLPGQDPTEGYAMDRDTYLAQLVEDVENAARLRRVLKAKVIVRKADGSLVTFKGWKPDAVTLKRVALAIPDGTVLNSLPVAEAVAILLAQPAVAK